MKVEVRVSYEGKPRREADEELRRRIVRTPEDWCVGTEYNHETDVRDLQFEVVLEDREIRKSEGSSIDREEAREAAKIDADQITLDNWNEILHVEHKMARGVVHAVQLEEGFDVTTPDGVRHGDPGDYMVFGPGGRYVFPKFLFGIVFLIVGKHGKGEGV